MEQRGETVVMDVDEKASKWCEENGLGAFWERVSPHDVEFKYTRTDDFFRLCNGNGPLVTLSFGEVHARLYHKSDEDDDDATSLVLRINSKAIIERSRFNVSDISEAMEISVTYEPDDAVVWEDDILALAPDALELMPPVALLSLLVELAISTAFETDNNAMLIPLLEILNSADSDTPERTEVDMLDECTNDDMFRVLKALAKGDFDY